MIMAIDKRVQVRVDDSLADWLAERAARRATPGGSISVQARLEIDTWRTVLRAELRRIRLTLSQACAIADVTQGWMDDGLAVGSLLAGEVQDAFRVARDSGPMPGLSSYGRKWAPTDTDPDAWEDRLVDYLNRLGPAADYALRDAMAAWWQHHLDPTIDGFAQVGLQVLPDPTPTNHDTGHNEGQE